MVRCRRIDKECRPGETVRRRGHRKPAVSKASRLEEKLDSLVSLIKAGAQTGAVVTFPSVPPVTIGSNSCGNILMTAGNSILTENKSEGSPFSSSSNEYTESVPVSTPATEDSASSSFNQISSCYHATTGEPSPTEEAKYFSNFQTYKSKYFPYVYIPSTTTVHQLRQERPFLWLCIMAVGSDSISQQQVLSTKVRQTISQEMIAKSETNIDLLLGLLTFIGWAHFQIQTKPFLGLFNQLAMSMVFELKLNKPVAKDAEVLPCVREPYSKPRPPRTQEERRAVLGCFLISSIISSFLQKIDGLRWTRHMDECLQILGHEKECPNDEVLIELVQLQLVLEKKGSGDWAMRFINQEITSSSLHDNPFKTEFYEIKTKLLAEPRTNEVVLLHLYSAELDMTLPPLFLHTNQDTYQQQKAVHASLVSIKSWFDIFFTIPPAAYTEFSFSMITYLFRCVITLYRLTATGDSIQDERSVLKTADSLLILDRVIRNLEEVSMPAGLESTDNPQRNALLRSVHIFRSFRPVWEAKLGAEVILNTQTLNETFPLDDLGVEFLDNDWLMDLLLSPSYFNDT
ncbi:hypothetical protein D0Z07_2967 [Hyphodiscus hymeniophilus]|uniref:Transcription factor domain-containing protein n=1 Tax=Hyphodiscus hymeniophilus TaxID=353542 RepID=A0A9P7AYS4_9HELO|nr:hypothetical protein D0Z07_2967 [Hyphodiscus hymeniophilus]